MKNWALVYVLSLFVTINAAQNTPAKSEVNIPELKNEFIKLEDVSLSEEHYDSNGERVIRTVGISSTLLDRIHSMNCIGIHQLALDLLETNRHNQNLLIHNLRKFISQRDTADVSNIKIQDLIPSPNLKLPSPTKIQQTRNSNSQKNTQTEESLQRTSKEINLPKQKKQSNFQQPTSKNEQFQHFTQLKNHNRNNEENAEKTFLTPKRKTSNQNNASRINRSNSHLSIGQMNTNVSLEHQKDKGKIEQNDSDKRFASVERHLPDFQNTKQHNRQSATSFNQHFPSKSQDPRKRNNPDNIHGNSQRSPKRQHNNESQEKINFEKTAQEPNGHESKTLSPQDNNKKIKNKKGNIVQKHVLNSNRTYEESERSRRENSRKISSASQGATSIENFLQRYPEIRRISSRFNNDSPQRVLNEHSRITTKSSITSKTTPQTHVLRSTTKTIRAPPTKRVKTTTNSPRRLSSQKDQDQRGILVSKNNSTVHSNESNNPPDFDNSYDELSSADYSYLYYQDYYDELVPPHHRFQQLNNRKGPQFKTSSTSTKQSLINDQKLKEKKKIKGTQEINHNSQIRRQHQRRFESSSAKSSNNQKRKHEHHNSRNNSQKPNQSLKSKQHQNHDNLNGTSKAIKTQSQKNVKEEKNQFNGAGSTDVSVGPFGYTDKGDYFSDESVSGFPEIIDITYQGFVWAMSIQYPKKEKKIHGGIHTILKDKVKEKRINLVGDHIIRVTGRASPYNINRLTLHTSNGKTYGPFGERQHKESVDFDESAPPGHALAYLSGTINFGVPLRSIAFHWRPIESS